MIENNSAEHLASRARVEIFVQAVRVIKALTRNKRQKDAMSLVDAMRAGTVQSWKIDIEGIRGKRLFKKSMAVMRNLMGDFSVLEILPSADIDYLEKLARM